MKNLWTTGITIKGSIKDGWCMKAEFQNSFFADDRATCGVVGTKYYTKDCKQAIEMVLSLIKDFNIEKRICLNAFSLYLKEETDDESVKVIEDLANEYGFKMYYEPECDYLQEF